MSQHGYPERVSRRGAGAARGAGKPCTEDAGTIEVLVETLTGTAFEMTVSPLDTVLAIKAKIFRVEGIPVSQQHLLYNLQELDDASSLQEHCIDDGATLRLVLAMRGGPVSTHRLPAPAPRVHWRECRERDDGEESGECLPAGSKVTLLVFRDGENVSMVRVVENDDGTYSPLADTHLNNSSSLKNLIDEINEEGGAASLQDNAVTMSKMLQLRRRMESLSVRRGARHTSADRLADGDRQLLVAAGGPSSASPPPEGAAGPAGGGGGGGGYASYSELEDTFAPLYDGSYTRYEYDCSFADRYTLLPPITADSEQSAEDEGGPTVAGERMKLSEALAGPILVKSAGVRRGGDVRDEPRSPRSPRLPADLLASAPAHVPAADYGPLVGGGEAGGGWRVRRAFGSSSQLAPPAPLAPAHSASSLRPAPPPHHHHHQHHPHHPPPLSDALFSSSTSDLEKLKRNRFLPALCRHRNREHLDVSDERLDREAAAAAAAATAARPARSLEVGSERRHRRIKKIAELESAEAPRPSLFRFHDSGYESSIRKLPNDGAGECSRTEAARAPTPEAAPPPQPPPPDGDKKMARVRCGLCRKRLSIATVHRCRCGAEFCAPHRYAEVHGCAYDYKAHALAYLQRANPLVSAPKLPKI